MYRIALFIAALLLATSLASPASAAFINEVYSTDFTGEPDNAIPTDWSVVATGGQWYIQGEEYKHTAAAAGSNVGLSVYEGDVAGAIDASTLTDYTVRTTIRVSGLPAAGGVVARYTDASNFYHLRINLSDAMALQLYSWSTDGGAAQLLDSAPLSSDFRKGELVLTVEGSQITGELRDYDTNAVITTLSAIDTHNTSGTFGLRNSGASVTFVSEEVSVYTAIPEPASLVLMGLGTMLVLKRRSN